jgi:zinc/manganese transport system substrate-binding protein/manganese/iron transport system substrate-binding protein
MVSELNSKRRMRAAHIILLEETMNYFKKMMRMVILLFILSLLVACSSSPMENESPFVLATTSIVGDVVTEIGGDLIEVRVLLPANSDPHSFQSTPQDLVAIEQAQLVFVNGFGLEEFLGGMIADSAGDKVVELSQGVTPIYFEEEAEQDHHGVDPHMWMAPLNVAVWAENVAAALVELDPANAAEYQANARAYQQELTELDLWISEQISSVPVEQRLLVADHETFNYLAQAYGLEIVGALTGFSSLAESSARELAALEDAISALGVPAIFVSTTVPPGLAEQVAADTGVRVVRVYSGSLSAVDGPAATYLEMMRYTISLMVEALR